VAASTPTMPDATTRAEELQSEPLAARVGTATFYRKRGKRLVDATISFVALLLLSPFLLLIAILVKLTSHGPALYWQERVGRDGRVFRMAKFRSMVADAARNGRPITAAGDERVTPIGAVLRKLKIDEVPQLWNVLRGEMSLVGPRPEVPLYVRSYTPAQRQVLSAAPGITDPASIAYRHEEQVLSASADPDALYRETILPHKLALNLEYIRRMSFSGDIGLILKTLASIFD
jgi:lipopolysaccharide/colanic/teichoic acid biosynthesis glycosyltransferase